MESFLNRKETTENDFYLPFAKWSAILSFDTLNESEPIQRTDTSLRLPVQPWESSLIADILPLSLRFVVILTALISLPSLSAQISQPKTAEEQGDSDKKAMAIYTDAANFQKGGAYSIAIETWQQFLEQYPSHPFASSAWYYLGICYMQKQEPNFLDAAQAFERTLLDEEFKSRTDALSNLSWCLYSQAIATPNADRDLLQKSLSLLEQLRSNNPTQIQSDQSFLYSGEISYRLGNLTEAVDFYDKLLQNQNPDSPLWVDAMYGKGVALEEAKQNQSAIETYLKLVERGQRETILADVEIRLGDLYITEKQFEDALKHFRAATTSTKVANDRAYAIFREAFTLVQLEEYELAGTKYTELLEQYPSSVLVTPSQLAKAQSYYRLGKLDLAEAEFRKVLNSKDISSTTEATHWLVRIKISQSRHIDAVELINQQLERGTGGTFAVSLQMDLAEAYAAGITSEEKRLGKEKFHEVFENYPGDPLAPKALFNAAVLAFQLNENQESLNYAKEFINQYSNTNLISEIRYIKAEAEHKLGDSEASSQSFIELISAKSGDPSRRAQWLLRAASHWNETGNPSYTIQWMVPEQQLFVDAEQKAEFLLLTGQAYIQTSDLDQAIQRLRQALNESTNSVQTVEIQYALGEALRGSGKADEALACWEGLINAEPLSEASNRARYQVASLALERNELNKAITFYEQVASKTNSSRLKNQATYGWAWALIQSQQYQEAVVTLEPLLKNTDQPQYFDTLIASGIAHRGAGNLAEAIKFFELALGLATTNERRGNALFELSRVHSQGNQPKKSAALLQRIVDEIPDYPDLETALHELGWAYRDSLDSDKALEVFTEQLSRYPESVHTASAAYYIGQHNYSNNEFDQAIEYFELARRTSQDADLTERSIYRVAWSLFNQKKFDPALVKFEQLADQFTEGALHFDALAMKGECLYRQQQYDQALLAFKTARDRVRSSDENAKKLLDPSDRQIREIVFLHGGQSAAQLKRWSEAIAWYDELRERFPATSYLPEVFYETGFAHQQAGNHPAALELLREVANNYRNESAARARFIMGEIFFADGQLELAIPEFQRVMYGFNAENATDSIKNWQAKSGFEAGRCSELVLSQANQPQAKQRAKDIAISFYQYLIDKHPNHDLVGRARERIEALKIE